MTTIRYGSAFGSRNQAQYRSSTPLDNDTIARYAPSVLATEAHESRGERYAFIPTINVLEGLRNEGFLPYEVRQTRCRDLGKREFTKHLVRLRHVDAKGNGAEVPEIVLVNSHDGTSSYQLIAGVFRLICSNGLIAGDICDDIRIRHSGNVISDVIEGSYRVLDNIKQVEGRIDTYKSINLLPAEQQAFADAAARLRWDEDDNGNLDAPIRSTSQLLLPHRYDDRKNDLWTTFNVAQENLVRGGISGRSKTGRRTRTREVGGVNENVKLNRALWTLADQLAKYKTGEGLAIAA